MTASETLDRLSQAENFQTWTFGRMDEALRYGKDRAHRSSESFEPPTHLWEGEPDKVQWIDPTTGYDCLIVRNHLGALCGYVGVPPTHPWHGLEHGTCPLGDACDQKDDDDYWYCEHRPGSVITVHGGLTFSDFCEPGEPVDGICHRAMDGRPDNVFWFGFDCGHAWDLIPGMDTFLEAAAYRDLEFVADEIAAEAIQLSVLAPATEAEVKQAVESITSDARPEVT